MAAQPRRYEVISVSLPHDLVKRANELIPRSRRSRVIAAVLATFLDSISQRKVAEEYAAYDAGRSSREAREERDLLDEWALTDAEARTILDRETRRGRRPARGDVVLASLDSTIGVEIRKTRPVIVVSNDSINHFSQRAVVVPLTRNVSRLSPSHALLPKGTSGLQLASKAVTEQIKAVDKRRLVRRLGSVPPELMAHVERALKRTLAFT